MSQGLGGLKKPAKMGLGRGLSALISTQPAAPVVVAPQQEPASNVDTPVVGHDSAARTSPEKGAEQGGVTYLKLSQISANPEQPRTHFSEQEINELSESIKAFGLLQPILVRPFNGSYQIVAGERRYRAATQAGIEQVPVLIRDLSERETLEIALVENVQRQGLNPIEEGQGYQRLMEDFSLSAQEVAERVGKDRASVANIVRLLKLPPVIQEMLKDGRLSVGHAKAILTVKEPVAQIGLANKIIAENLSVRAIEAIVSREVVFDAPKKGSTKTSVPEGSNEPLYPELEERLRNVLGTKVTIDRSRKGGKIELHFYSDEELDRLVQLLA
jgi:ParB family chromosome partitioning protein